MITTTFYKRITDKAESVDVLHIAIRSVAAMLVPCHVP